ncbi:hypothetical protein FO488_16505 [Geobacter sp. FeAm09]|uniref:hypothetical protein n=1 Tax=Geobacter sp. FeAm09 TaxID=2597769 RepID=UPI0011EC7929|nr:hypothetical protein [Geobacter sp. FeAm09]QEM69594.1 hypothetical protein FO488_16505 [Geobacter sp. FeAm09]
MSIKKRILAVAAASALGAMAAVPAMAFENEFHGSYTLKYFLSNYERGAEGNGVITPGVAYANATQNLKTNNYFEQRARIFYTAKANDDLKLVTAFEIDSVFGDRAQGSIAATNSNVAQSNVTAGFRNSGGAMESDAVNLETKWVYLQFKVPSTPTTVIAGIQPFKDSIKGIFLDADIAGVITSTKLNNATLNAGYLRAYDQSYFSASSGQTNLVRGNENLDIGAVELKYALSKDANVGGAYYIYADGRTNYVSGAENGSTMVHVIALTGDAKIGKVALSGFGAYQGGVIRGVTTQGDSAYLNAFAYNVAAKAAVGPGTLRSALLFTSGNANNPGKHYTGWVGVMQSPNSTWSSTNGANSYNESGMMLFNRNAGAQGTSTDSSLVYNSGNGTSPINGQGLYLYTLGYDATITPKAFASANVGLGWAAHTNSLKPTDKSLTGSPKNASNFMGTEINVETGYKMYDNLTAKIQAAYLVLGGYYAKSATGGKDPENPYTGRVVLSYAF